ncbi:MAG TPA: RodZ domain-containing protein [Casimicrobiaceae bacterium]
MSATHVGLDVSLSSAPVSHSGPGARLRASREAAGLSLDQVAQQLKLAPRQVKALEDEDFAQLPGRTFARGFVRNYARLLNLDADSLLAQLPDAAQAPALGAPALRPTGAAIADLPTAAVARFSLMRWLIPVVLVASIAAAGAYEWYRGGAGVPGGASRPAAPAPRASAELPAQSPTQLPTQPPAVASPAGTISVRLPNPLAAGDSASAAQSSDASTRAAAAPSPEAAAAAPETLAPLVLRYRGPAWTEVRDRDGQVLLSRLVAAGAEQEIRGTGPFDIVIGNARAVTLVHRGKPIELSRYTRQNVARLRLP